MRRTLALFAIIGIVIIENTLAQGPVGLTGVITDPYGGVLPGVTVTLSHVDLVSSLRHPTKSEDFSSP